MLAESVQAPYVLFDQVEVRYSELVTGLSGVSIRIHKGEFVFLVGQTGAGKSTFLKVLTREVQHTSGLVQFAGRDLGQIAERDVPALRREIGIVPQDFGLLPDKNVWENVGYAMRAVGRSKREVRKAVPDILERVKVLHRADARPGQLSGGEQQRVAIGRALVNNPNLLLADEPTGNLDPDHGREIMELLAELNLRGATVIVATHNLGMVARMGKRVVAFERGRIVDGA